MRRGIGVETGIGRRGEGWEGTQQPSQSVRSPAKFSPQATPLASASSSSPAPLTHHDSHVKGFYPLPPGKGTQVGSLACRVSDEEEKKWGRDVRRGVVVFFTFLIFPFPADDGSGGNAHALITPV